eukprot:COSAG05_NODE_1055_length_6012_cov_4.772028_1_plen_117_part_10
MLMVLRAIVAAAAVVAGATAIAGPEPQSVAFAQLLARHHHGTAEFADTHSALAALSQQKRKTPPPAAIQAAAGSGGARPSPNCLKQMNALCGQQKGNASNPDVAACQQCTTIHESTL